MPPGLRLCQSRSRVLIQVLEVASLIARAWCSASPSRSAGIVTSEVDEPGGRDRQGFRETCPSSRRRRCPEQAASSASLTASQEPARWTARTRFARVSRRPSAWAAGVAGDETAGRSARRSRASRGSARTPRAGGPRRAAKPRLVGGSGTSSARQLAESRGSRTRGARASDESWYVTRPGTAAVNSVTPSADQELQNSCGAASSLAARENCHQESGYSCLTIRQEPDGTTTCSGSLNTVTVRRATAAASA